MPQPKERGPFFFPCSLSIAKGSKCLFETENMTAPQIHHTAEQTVTIRNENTMLGGFLGIPSPATGIVLFAHGSGSGRFSPRNHFVSQYLQRGGIATLLI